MQKCKKVKIALHRREAGGKDKRDRHTQEKTQKTGDVSKEKAGQYQHWGQRGTE